MWELGKGACHFALYSDERRNFKTLEEGSYQFRETSWGNQGKFCNVSLCWPLWIICLLFLGVISFLVRVCIKAPNFKLVHLGTGRLQNWTRQSDQRLWFAGKVRLQISWRPISSCSSDRYSFLWGSYRVPHQGRFHIVIEMFVTIIYIVFSILVAS